MPRFPASGPRWLEAGRWWLAAGSRKLSACRVSRGARGVSWRRRTGKRDLRGDLRPGVSGHVRRPVRGSCAENPVERPGYQAPAGRAALIRAPAERRPAGGSVPAGGSCPAGGSFPAGSSCAGGAIPRVGQPLPRTVHRCARAAHEGRPVRGTGCAGPTGPVSPPPPPAGRGGSRPAGSRSPHRGSWTGPRSRRGGCTGRGGRRPRRPTRPDRTASRLSRRP